MKESINSVMLIIRDVVFGEDNYHYEDFINDDINYLFKMFGAHSLTHLLASKIMMFKEIDFSTGIYKKIKQTYLKEIRRLARQDVICHKIEKMFNDEKIQYLFLKGENIRKQYPERWMRNSNDVDILVREKDFKIAKNLIINELNPVKVLESTHHTEIITEKNAIIELHKCALSNPNDQKKDITSVIWETSRNDTQKKYKRIIRQDLEYVHHIIHMKGHFCSGGCGIRFFIDLFLLKNKLQDDEIINNKDELLKKYEIEMFSKECDNLAERWFGNTKGEYSKKLEEYVITGGTFGILSQKILINQNNKINYVFRRIFPKYERLVLQYPILEEKKYLTPYFEIKRILFLLNAGHLKTFIMETKELEMLTKEEVEDIIDFKKKIGL